VLWRPGCAVSGEALIALAERLAAVPRADADAPANHVDHLEAAAVALSLARYLLAPDRPERPMALLSSWRTCSRPGRPVSSS